MWIAGMVAHEDFLFKPRRRQFQSVIRGAPAFWKPVLPGIKLAVHLIGIEESRKIIVIYLVDAGLLDPAHDQMMKRVVRGMKS